MFEESKLTSFRPPNLVIGGFGKCGTTSLSNLLLEHPDICLNESIKEPHTYSLTERYHVRNGARQTSKQAKYHLDASTTYAVSDCAFERIHADSPNAKVILILRDPIDRVISHYNWYSKMGGRLLPLERELTSSSHDWAEKEHMNLNWKFFVETSAYAKHVLRAKKLFRSLKIVYLEDLERNQAETLSSILEWLNLQSDMPSQKRQIANKTDDLAPLPMPSWLARVRRFPQSLIRFVEFYPYSILRHGAAKKLGRRVVFSNHLGHQIRLALHYDTLRYQEAGIDINKFKRLSALIK